MNLDAAFRTFGVLAVAVLFVSRAPATPPNEPGALAWDALEKNYAAKVGDQAANIAFSVTNIADGPVDITAIKPSCGCTTFDVPPLPWKLAPGQAGEIKLKIDLTDKFGEMTKTIRIISSAGDQNLVVHLSVPLPLPSGDRRKAAEAVMRTDRQAIFRRDDCVTCHAHPAAFKTGEPLFQAVCAICHAAEHRASMVPDLAAAKTPRDAAFWHQWISEGREDTLMPGFSQAAGGPLTREQIESLVAYALKAFPSAATADVSH